MSNHQGSAPLVRQRLWRRQLHSPIYAEVHAVWGPEHKFRINLNKTNLIARDGIKVKYLEFPEYSNFRTDLETSYLSTASRGLVIQ